MKSCYLIQRGNDKNLFISIYQDVSSNKEWNENEDIHIFSANQISKEDKDSVLYTLYNDIDKGVDRWMTDVRYVPRLLIGGLIFLVSYFFFSLAVRDPIPMIDEMVIASAITFISIVAISRRDKRSDLSLKKRFELKQKASECVYEIAPELGAIEQYLFECSQLDTIDLADSIAIVDGKKLPHLPLEISSDYMIPFRAQFLTHIRLYHKDIYSLYKRYLKVLKDEAKREAFSARLLRAGMNGLSLSLLATTIEIANQ